MTGTLDPRIVRLSVEINGVFHVFEGLDIVARGRKTTNPQENACEVTISNLTKNDRDYILTATSPFIGRQRTAKKMIVEAGRVSTGVRRLFYGDITASQITQPPDIGLTLRFQTGAHKKGVVVARQGREVQPLSSLAAGVAKDMGVGLTFEADDIPIANYSFSGAVAGQLETLSSAGNVDVFVDDTNLIVKNKGVALRNRVRILNKTSGMIGIPEFTERGLRVRAMIDAETTVGGTVRIESQLNPAANGDYVVYSLGFDVASRREAFYYEIEAQRPGQIVRKKKKS
jgi:hypothetical protein